MHRPRYDDWSLPKGKVDPGETDEQAAIREVREEASIDARLGPELPTTTYLDRSGKHKRVRYWAMTVAGGDPAGDNEVDEAVWVPLDEARARLCLPEGRGRLDALAATTGVREGRQPPSGSRVACGDWRRVQMLWGKQADDVLERRTTAAPGTPRSPPRGRQPEPSAGSG